MIENISVLDLRKLSNINIIDIRSIQKYNNGHIKNAINIALEQILIKPEKYLSKDKKYYLYCQVGIQSRKLCQILSQKGFKVVNILGGYESWILNE